MHYQEALKHRRSRYQLNDEEIVSRDKIKEIFQDGLLHIPSPFNIQANRVLLLFGKESDDFWDALIEVMRENLDEEQFPKTEKKLEGFKAGYGTALVYVYQPSVDEMKEKFPNYAHNFEPWAEQSSGMFQYYVWSALQAEGLATNLQHYNELIEDWTKEHYDVPDGWAMRAQIPFGKPTGEPGDKDFRDLDETFIVKA